MDLQTLVDDIRIEAPAALDHTLLRAVRFSVMEFCLQSEAWRHTESIAVNVGDTEFYLGLPRDTYIKDLVSVHFNDGQVGRFKLSSVLPNRVNPSTVGNPTEAYVTSQQLVVNPVGEVSGSLDVEVIIVPKRQSISEIDDELGERYFETLRCGALARLFEMPGYEWSDGKLSGHHYAKFEQGIRAAKRDARRDRSRPKRAIKYGGL